MKKVEKLAEEIKEFIKYEPVWGEADILGILDKHAPAKKPFPKHMVSNNGDVVLFDAKTKHTDKQGKGVVQISNGMKIGYVYDSWNMNCFVDCEIEVKS